MKFPLYNECPNCGHESAEHNDFVHSCECKCPLSEADVGRAISIQAAVEVALQRARVGEKVSHSRTTYPHIPDGPRQIFGTSAHRLHKSTAADIGRFVKVSDWAYVFCDESEAEGAFIGMSDIDGTKCAIIDTSQRGRFSK